MSHEQLTDSHIRNLAYLEANSDDEITIPLIVRSYVALSHQEGITPEQVSRNRNGEKSEFLSIAKLYDEDLLTEWEWASKFAQMLLQSSEKVVAINLFDVSTVEQEQGFRDLPSNRVPVIMGRL